MKTWFANLKIRTKLLLSSSSVAAIAAIVGLIGFNGLTRLNENTAHLIDVRIPSSRSLLALSESQQAVWVGERGLINQLMMRPDIRKAQYAWIDAAFLRADSANAVLAGLPKTPEQQALWERVQSSWQTWLAAHKEVRQLSEEKDRLVASNVSLNDPRIASIDAQAFKASLDSRQKALDVQKDLKSLIKLDDQIAAETAQQSKATESTASITLWATVVVAVILAMVLGLVITRMISQPITKALEMVRLLSRGSLGMRLEAETNDEVGEMSRAMNSLADTLKGIAGTMDDVARGNLSVTITELGDGDEITPSLTRTVTALRGLVAQMQLLTDAAVHGKLSTRGDVSTFEGAYREIIAGVNATLEAVIGPLTTAARYVDAISKGEIPEKITDEYHGDFNTIKNNLNVCIDTVDALVADTKALSRAAIDGRLSTRADATRHQGDFKVIVEGVNQTLDALVNYLDAMPVPAMIVGKDMTVRYMNKMGAAVGNTRPEAVVGQKCYNHFRTTDCNTERCACQQAMVKNTAASSEATARPASGEMEIGYSANPIHAEDGSVIGAFEVISDQTVVKKQMRSASIVSAYQKEEATRLAEQLTKLAQGDLRVSLEVGAGSAETIEARDQYLLMTDALRRVVEAVQTLVADAQELAAAGVEGKLGKRAQTEKHAGEYRKIVQGFNDTLDAVIKPVQEGSAVLAEMAKGDLTVSMVGDYRGDHQLLKDSINTVAGSLEKALQDVAAAVSAAASASNQISSSTEELAAGAQEQTSQAAEVAGAVEEMAKTIMENSRNASETAVVAKEAKTNAEAGGLVVADTVKGMRRISEVVLHSAETVKELGKSSDQIGEIITVIDDIADQTNLLALNAAIEAARAGDQGRGFAVVADEVRKLAERTTKATKEIAGMIKKIQEDTHGAVASMQIGTQEVESGIALADKAGVALGDIVKISQRVTDMVTQIAAASEQQSSASEQISKNVEAISTVTSQSASGTQQIARAAEDLSRMSDNLQRLVGQFTVSKENKSGGAKREEKSSVAVRSNGKLVKNV